MSMYDAYLGQQLTKLRTEIELFEGAQDLTDREMRKEILASKRSLYELRVLVTSMVETLVAADLLNFDVLEERMENRFAEEGWSAEHPEPTTADRPYSCVGCYHAMAMSEGTMSPSGMRCQRCAR
jgi:hypothetical protein